MSTVDRLNRAAKKVRQRPGDIPADLALLLADWLEAEAQVRVEMEPFVRLVSAAMVAASGNEKATLSIAHDPETGAMKMDADSSPTALRVAARILGEQP